MFSPLPLIVIKTLPGWSLAMKKKILGLSALSAFVLSLSSSLPLLFSSPQETLAATYVTGSEISFTKFAFTKTDPIDFSSNLYYKNDGSVGSSADYNIHFDDYNHKLVLRNFLGGNITCTSSSLLKIEVQNTGSNVSTIFGSEALADSSKNYFGIKSSGDIELYSDSEQNLIVLIASIDGGILSAGIYSSGSITIGGKLELNVMGATAYSDIIGLCAEKGIKITDDAKTSIHLGVKTNTHGLYTEGGEVLIDSREETKISLERNGDDENVKGNGIYNGGASSSIAGNGMVKLKGEGNVAFTADKAFNSTGIKVESMSSGAVIIDGVKGEVNIDGFHTGIDVDSSGGEEIQITNEGILRIGGGVDLGEELNRGIVAFSNDVLIDGGEYYYEGDGEPLVFKGMGIDHYLYVQGTGEKTILDWKSDATIDLTNAIVSIRDLPAYSYFKITSSAGNKPNFDGGGIYLDAACIGHCYFLDDSWVEIEKTSSEEGIRFDTPYDLPYLIVSNTLGSSKLTVNDDVPLDWFATPGFINGQNTASSYEAGTAYNAVWNYFAGTLTLTDYDGGAIIFEGDNDQAVLKIVIEGECKIHADQYGIRAKKGSIIIYADQSFDQTRESVLSIEVDNISGKPSSGIQIDSGDLWFNGEASVDIAVSNNSNFMTRGISVLNGDFYLWQASRLSVKNSNDHTTTSLDSDVGVSVGDTFILDTSSSLSLIIDNSGVASSSYALKANAVEILNFGMVSLSWRGKENEPYSPSDIFDPSLETIKSYEAPIGQLRIYKGETRSVSISWGKLDRTEAKYMPGEKVGVEAMMIPGIEFARWVSGDTLIFDDINASKTKFVMPDKDTSLQASYKVFEVEPCFDSHGASDSGYLHFRFALEPLAARLIKDPKDVSSKVHTSDSFNSKTKIDGNFVAEGDYYLATQYKDNEDNPIWLVSDPFHIEYGQAALDHDVKLYKASGELGATLTQKGGKMVLPEYNYDDLADNKKFVAWAEGSLTGAQYKAGDEYEVFDEVEFFALTAERTQYTSSFNSNGASDNLTSDTCYEGATYKLPSWPFDAPEGKKFLGWKANNEGEMLYPEDEVVITADTVFYAQWGDIEESSVSSEASSESTASSKDASSQKSEVTSKSQSATSSEDEMTPTPDHPSSGGGLSTGATIGIILGAVAGAGLIGFSVIWFGLKKKTFADLATLFKKNPSGVNVDSAEVSSGEDEETMESNPEESTEKEPSEEPLEGKEEESQPKDESDPSSK